MRDFEGSLAETHYLLLLARDLGYLVTETCDSLVAEADEIARMLHALRLKVADQDGPA